jgi:hypothetical protein
MHRRRPFAGVRAHDDETIQQCDTLPAQPVSLSEDPVVVQRGEQLAAVRLHGMLGRGLEPPPVPVSIGDVGSPRCRLERGDIQAARCVVPPMHRGAVDRQAGVRIGKRLAELVQLPAQIGARLGIRRVGPEELGNVAARLRCAAVHGEVAEQRKSARRTQRVEPSAIDADALLAQQGDLEHDPLPGRERTLSNSTDGRVGDGDDGQRVGGMFWLTRKKLSGSYCAFTVANRV